VVGVMAALAGCAPNPSPQLSTRLLYCLIGQACSIAPPRAISACVSDDDGPPPTVQACIAEAGSSCAAARACTWDATHPSACGLGGTPACQGDVAISCDDRINASSQTDCAALGQQCIVGPLSALCGFGTCDQPVGPATCVGSAAAYCATPFLLGESCAPEGATCVGGSDGGATCQGDGELCFLPSCDGQVLVACKDGRQARQACPVGQSCVAMAPGGTGPMCGIASDCDPRTYFERCDGSILSYCYLGRKQQIDCATLGFPTCQGSPIGGCFP
jgi:hypothetical protein